VSPSLDVSADQDLVMSFQERHDFETDPTSFYDGGVIEVSIDGGVTWTDMSATKDPGYEGTIGDTSNQATNPLKGQKGFVGQNPSYPSFDAVSVNLGHAFAGKTINVRFRIATDEGGGANGWELDDIGFTGLTNAPFAGLLPNATPCPGVVAGGEGEGEGEGSAAAGEGEGEGAVVSPAMKGCGCTSDGSASDAALGALALVAVVAIRKRRR
jgi:MYXO-CTERM domain-containing protein